MKADCVTVPAVINSGSLRTFAADLNHCFYSSPRRLIVLQGGNGTFCRGVDLSAFSRAAKRTELAVLLSDFAGCLRSIRRGGKPVIAAVDGDVLGGGMGILAACDVVIATARSAFGLPESLFGLAPSIILPMLLERAAPQTVRLWALTGSSRTAAEARAAGFVDVVVDAPALESAVRYWIRQLSRAESAAVAEIKASAEVPRQSLEAALNDGISVTRRKLTDPAVLHRIRRFTDEGQLPWEETQ